MFARYKLRKLGKLSKKLEYSLPFHHILSIYWLSLKIIKHFENWMLASLGLIPTESPNANRLGLFSCKKCLFFFLTCSPSCCQDARLENLQRAADSMASHAQELAFDPDYMSPFAKNATAHGFQEVKGNIAVKKKK